MQNLRTVLEQSETNSAAIGHFNISTLVILRAVFETAREQNVPVIVGASERERQFVGDHQLFALVRSLRDEHGFPIVLNADHMPPDFDGTRDYLCFRTFRFFSCSVK